MGTDSERTHNFGSLDVEYAKSIDISYKYGNGGDYVVVLHHALKGENPNLILKVLEEEWGRKIHIIKSNSDEGIQFGTEEYTPEEYIDLIASAKLLVGNSSSFLKEASIFGTPVVMIGDRQKNRLRTKNVLDCNFDEKEMRQAIRKQLKADFKPDNTYFKENTALNIANVIKSYCATSCQS